MDTTTASAAANVAARIKGAMDEDSVSALLLSSKTGIPRSTLTRSLDGHRDLTVVELERIARVLNTKFAYLATGSLR